MTLYSIFPRHSEGIIKSGSDMEAFQNIVKGQKQKCGFSTYSNFYKAFSAQTGISPSSY